MSLTVCKTYLWTCLSESVSSMYHISYYSFTEFIILLFAELTILQLMAANWALSTVSIVKQEDKDKNKIILNQKNCLKFY